MDMNRHSWKLVILAACLVLACGLIACEPEGHGPKAWFDSPRDGARLPAQTPVSVLAHAFAKNGVNEVLLSVNGVPYARGPIEPAGESFGEITQDWVPPEPGSYVLRVQAYDQEGRESPPDTINIRVVGVVTPTQSPVQATLVIPTIALPTATLRAVHVEPTPVTPEPAQSLGQPTQEMLPPSQEPGAPTDTPWPPAQIDFQAIPASIEGGQCSTLEWTVLHASAVLLDGESVAGTGSKKVCPQQTQTHLLHVEAPGGGGDRQVTIQVSTRPTDTPVSPAQISFRADQTSIEQGQCTTLRWDVENATAVYLDGDGVMGHDSRQVCPAQNQTYTLHVEAAQGGGDRQVTIQVSAPQDTTPPPVPAPAVPANGLSIGCKANQNLVWVPVDDPSGIAGYYVKLELQVKKGEYQSVRGWGPVGGKQVEADVQCGVIYRWAVRAQDKAGNTSDWSGWSLFSVEGLG